MDRKSRRKENYVEGVRKGVFLDDCFGARFLRPDSRICDSGNYILSDAEHAFIRVWNTALPGNHLPRLEDLPGDKISRRQEVRSGSEGLCAVCTDPLGFYFYTPFNGMDTRIGSVNSRAISKQ